MHCTTAASLEMSDEPYFCPYRTWLDMLHDVRRVLPWAMETFGLSARLCLLVIPCCPPCVLCVPWIRVTFYWWERKAFKSLGEEG